MRFAVIGDIDDAVYLVRGIQFSADHEVAVCSVSGPLATALTHTGFPMALAASHEAALITPDVDAVIVAAVNVDESIYLCRQASQAGLHVVVLPPQAVSTAFSFELHLLLDESEHGIIPFFGRWYGRTIRSATAPPPVDVRQLSMDLPIADTDRLKRLQLQAVDFMCGCGFRFSQVTALDVPGADGQILSRSITLASSATAEVRSPPAVIAFTGNTDPQQDIHLSVTTGDGTVTQQATALVHPAAATGAEDPDLVRRLCEDLVTASSCQRRMEEFSNTLELIEGVEKSLRRRRTVDVYLDSVSERGAFKTQMTAIGCGVMAYVTFGLIAMAIAHALGMPAMLMRVGLIAWIAPVVIFLLAQLLLPLARDRVSPDDTEEAG